MKVFDIVRVLVVAIAVALFLSRSSWLEWVGGDSGMAKTTSIAAPTRPAAPIVDPAIAAYVAPRPLLRGLAGLRAMFGDCERAKSGFLHRRHGLKPKAQGVLEGVEGADSFVLFASDKEPQIGVAIYCRTVRGGARTVEFAFVDRAVLGSDVGAGLARIYARDRADGPATIASDPLARFGSVARVRIDSKLPVVHGPLEQALLDAYLSLMVNPAYIESRERTACCGQLFDEEKTIRAAIAAINATVKAPPGTEVLTIPRVSGTSPAIDGRFAPREWDGALVVEGGSNEQPWAAHLLADGHSIMVGVRLPGHRDPWTSPALQFQHDPSGTALVASQHVFLGGGMRRTYDHKVPENPRFYTSYRSSRASKVKWRGEEIPYGAVRGREAAWSPRMRFKAHPVSQRGFLTNARVAVHYDEHWIYEASFPFGEFGLAPGMTFRGMVRLSDESIDTKRWFVIADGPTASPDAGISHHAQWADGTDLDVRYLSALDLSSAEARAVDGAIDFVGFVGTNPDRVLDALATAGATVSIVPFEIYIDADDNAATGSAPPGVPERSGYEYRVVLRFDDYREALSDADSKDLQKRTAAVTKMRSATLYDLRTGEQQRLEAWYGKSRSEARTMSGYHGVTIPYEKIGVSPGRIVRLAFYEPDHTYEHSLLAFSLDRRLRLK